RKLEIEREGASSSLAVLKAQQEAADLRLAKAKETERKFREQDEARASLATIGAQEEKMHAEELRLNAARRAEMLAAVARVREEARGAVERVEKDWKLAASQQENAKSLNIAAAAALAAEQAKQPEREVAMRKRTELENFRSLFANLAEAMKGEAGA